jgi:phytoene synthase
MINPQTSSWEPRLLALAHEALEGHHPAEPIAADREILETAYTYCEQLTREHSRTFFLASGLLPYSQRRAIRALYAFCRISDDLVDRSEQVEQSALREWRQRSLASHPHHDDPVALAWTDSRTRYQIPRRYAEQLIDGVARDIHQKRYGTFNELAEYCYGVASTVGLMAMHIIGYSGPEAIPYAVKLGVALQKTNILRDVGEDWRSGRLYLPKEELDYFGLSETDIANGCVDNRWRAFMKFQIERNRELYTEAAPGISMLDPDGRFAIAAASGLYQAILEDIEAHDYDVFSRRAYTSRMAKLRRLPGIWWNSRQKTIG